MTPPQRDAPADDRLDPGPGVLRSRYLWKLYAGFAALIIATIVCAGLLTAERASRDARSRLSQRLSDTSRLLMEISRPHLSGDEHSTLQQLIKNLGLELKVRLTVIAPDGQVLAESHHDPAMTDNHANRPELVAARTNGIGQSERYSITVNQIMVYHARAIHRGDHLVGLARAALPAQQIQDEISNLRWSMMLAGALTAALSLPLGLYFARRVTQPLSQMTQVATAIAKGDLGQRSMAVGDDEVGRLSQALNTMAGQLAERLGTIEAERNQLQAVLTGMEEGLIAVDSEERITLINLPALRLIAYADDEPTRGKRIWEVCRRDEINRSASATLQQGTTSHAELTLAARGRDQHIDLRATAIRDLEGRVTGAVLLLHDITELRRLETVRRDFVANVSHELKTPLTAIRGMVETILDDPEMPDELRGRFLGRVLTQGERLTELVADLLTLSRIESTGAAIEESEVDLAAVTRISCEQLRTRAEAKGIELELRHQEGAVPVTGDQEFLRQVVDNLVDNAVKYTPEGGRVTVELRTTDDQAVLRVSDSGIGIAPSDQARVFERFYRVDKARSRELGSTGLGLSIVKHIILAHGGQVELDSSPGSGSTFTVRLPLRG